ncbi:MAG: RraA family protein [Oscillospiraceae bacterium]|nr:RraA family protein [Oscillospiraceae bacterium]
MAIGFRAYTKVKRAAPELVEAFRGIPVANIADNMGRIACLETGIVPFTEVPLLGTAITVKAAPNDNLMFHKAIDMAQPGDVIVVDGEASLAHSLCGDIMYTYAKQKGIVGFVVDGCIRDVDSLEALAFPVYARGVQPKGPYKNGPGEVNVPISCGGIVVHPGDIVYGDADGVVVIREADAPALIELSRKHVAMEEGIFEGIRTGTINREWVEKTLLANGGEIIDDYCN